MKISFTYRQEEARAASILVSILQRRFPGAKLRKSESHAPFIHAYLTIENAESPQNSGEKA